jgi:bacillithiol biosynthesis deacetylase BshB1
MPGSSSPAAARPVRRILAVGAHPDDVEFGCGGILIKEASRGHSITVLNLSRGESASSGSAEVREREAAAAAARMGVRLEFLVLEGDARLEYRPQNALEIARVVRRLRPHLLIAPSPEQNQHPDHGKAGHLARDAARLARYGGLAGLEPHEAHAIDALYFYDISGTGTALTNLAKVIVDISDVFETWKAAMECHRSQLKTRNYVELQVMRARLLGEEFGVSHAMAVWANDPIRVEGITDLQGSGRRF